MKLTKTEISTCIRLIEYILHRQSPMTKAVGIKIGIRPRVNSKEIGIDQSQSNSAVGIVIERFKKKELLAGIEIF